MTTKARTKKQRSIESQRPPGLGAEAAALATATGMMALGLAQEARAAPDVALAPQVSDVLPPPETPQPQLDLAYADLAQAVAPPVDVAPVSTTAPVTPPNVMASDAPAPGASLALGGSAPLQGGEKMIDPATIMHGGVGGHGPLQTSMEATLAQTLSTLGQTLDGLSVALHGAVQTLPVATLLQGALGSVQGAVAQVSELLGQTTQSVLSPVDSLIGALDPPQITAALDALSAPIKLPGELLAGLDGLPGLGGLGGSDLVTHGLDLLGAAPAPVVGLIGLSYAESIDPFDASHTPLGGVLHGLI